mgnify:CR=1 FL=1
MKNRLKINRAFTLVELIIAVSLFVIVAFISIGAILSVFDANKRAQATKTVVDNLNLSIENMARTVRFGNDYHCGDEDDLEEPQNCSNGDTLLAVQFDGNTIVYRLCDTAIKRAVDEEDCDDMQAITSPDTVIQYLKFYVSGSTPGPDTNQPYVIAVIKGYVGSKPTTQSIFSIETLMSQRTLDL